MARRFGIDGRAWRAVGALSYLVACASPYAAVDPTPPGPDGGADASSGEGGADGGPSPPDGQASDGAVPTGCNPTSKLGAPTRVEGAISGADEDSDAKVSEDELSMLFTSDRGVVPKKFWFYVVVRTSTTSPEPTVTGA